MALAGIGWTFLLLNGVSAALQKSDKTCIALIVFVVFQFFLHFVYGDSPFLYSAHYTPVLLLIGGYGLRRIAKSGVAMADNMQTLFAPLVGVKACANCYRSLNKSLISKAVFVVT